MGVAQRLTTMTAGTLLLGTAVVVSATPTAAGAPMSSVSASWVSVEQTPAAAECPWVGSDDPIADKVAQVVGEMTLDEKISQVHGIDRGDYTGRLPAIPRLCIPELKLQDGPVGVRMANTTQLPGANALAATFDTEAAQQYGGVIGTEMKAKGADVDLGPTVNIIRDPRWGRAFESYSEDPYLTAAIGSGTINGIQDEGVMAQVKHWAVYNQETNRNKPTDNAIIDDRTVHEIYTKAFDDIIDRANPSSAMCSYSTINGTFACENDYLDNILKTQWGYDGFVTSDWGGTHSAVASANAGMDMEMPSNTWFDGRLKSAVLGGTVPESRLDDMVSRILGQEFRFGLIDNPSESTPDAVASTDEHVDFARRISEQGTVLLRNENAALPLAGNDAGGAVDSIAVIGDSAGTNTLSGGGGSASVVGTGTVTPFQGIKARAGDDISVTYAPGTVGDSGALPPIDGSALAPAAGDGNGLTAEYFANIDLAGDPAVTRVDERIDAVFTGGVGPVPELPGENFSIRWTGALTPVTSGTHTLSLTSDDGSRLKINGETVIDNWGDHAEKTKTADVELTAGTPVDIEVDYYNAGKSGRVALGWLPPNTDIAQQAVDLAGESDVAVVYSSIPTSEGGDLENIDLSAADNDLIQRVAAVNDRTVVVLNTGSAVTMPWLDEVDAVLEAWYPGQESGNAIASLLFGDVNPSGRLPITFPKSLDQVPAADPERFPGVDGKVQYSEKRAVGYRWYDAEGLDPLFPFGFGLSYTDFSLSGLRLSSGTIDADGELTATVTVTNTGERAGSQTVQAYLTSPDPTGEEPPRKLVGVGKVDLEPGQSRQVPVHIRGSDATIWNAEAQQWELQRGDYSVSVGTSSRELPLTADFRVTRTAGPRYTEIQAPELVAPGTTFVATTSFTNEASTPATRVATELSLRDGWTASVDTNAWRSVKPGQTVQSRWTITVPESAPGGDQEMSATTAVAGRQTQQRTAVTTVPFASVADAFDLVGITHDADPGPGNFDGKGYSYSAEGLASVGLTPGVAVDGGFTWPAAEPGTANSVTAVGQTIAVDGEGSSLAFLGAATNATATGTATVHYTDGSSSTGTMTFADWYKPKAVPGSQLVATSPTWNRPEGSKYPHELDVGVFVTTVPLDAGKQVASVTLPSAETMHVFSIAVQD